MVPYVFANPIQKLDWYVIMISDKRHTIGLQEFLNDMEKLFGMLNTL